MCAAKISILLKGRSICFLIVVAMCLPDDLQDATLDGESLSGKFDKVDLSDETGYQKGLAMLERGQMPTPDMMSPQVNANR